MPTKEKITHEGKTKISIEGFLNKANINLDISYLFKIGLKREYNSFKEFDKDFTNKMCYSHEYISLNSIEFENYIKTYHKDLVLKYFKIVDELYDFEDSVLVKEYLCHVWAKNIMFALSKGYTKNSKLDSIYEVIIKDARVFMKNNNINLDRSNFHMSFERGNGALPIKEDTSMDYYE